MVDRVNRLLEESGALIQEGQRWLDTFSLGSEDQRKEYTACGGELARGMHSKAIDLCYNKATKFSDDIRTLLMLAAKVAVLTYGTVSPEISVYERDVYYYRAFPSCRAWIEEYDAFKRGCAQPQ